MTNPAGKNYRDIAVEDLANLRASLSVLSRTDPEFCEKMLHRLKGAISEFSQEIAYATNDKPKDFVKVLRDNPDKITFRLDDISPIYKSIDKVHEWPLSPILRTAIENAARKSKLIKESDFKRVIFDNNATVILWADGTKTVVKCQDGDAYSPEAGVAIAIMKKALGNKGNFNEILKRLVAGAKKR